MVLPINISRTTKDKLLGRKRRGGHKQVRMCVRMKKNCICAEMAASMNVCMCFVFHRIHIHVCVDRIRTICASIKALRALVM